MATLQSSSSISAIATALPTQVRSQSANSGSTVSCSSHRSLSWANGGGFGVSTHGLFLRPTMKSSADDSARNRTFHVSAFTPEQSKLVKDSWRLLQKNNPGEVALNFFLKVFEVAPTVKKMFSFLREESDVPLEKNPHLKAHALTVLSTTGQAAMQLGEKGALEKLMPKLMELGHTHVAYGVVDEHFDVVKYALLATLGEALPDQWTREMKAAWGDAYDELVEQIKNKMRAERAAPQLVA